ncbi:MAG: glycosyltransferase family 39 protein [Chloroflexota bacterium]
MCRKRQAQLLAELALVAALAGASFVVLRGAALRQPFSVDESRWIATSRYFWITFVDGDLFGPEWAPNYVVLTHPPVARYVIGLGLWLQGWHPDDLNGRYDADRSRRYNVQAGNIPSRSLLDAARRVMFAFALGAVLLLYVVGRSLGGPVAGATAVLLALACPLLTALWTRALAESILVFFTLLGFVLATRVVAARQKGADRERWSVGLGLAVGLATATKLSGALLAAGLAVYALARTGLESWQARRLRGPGPWIDAGLAAILTFVLVNPLLYPNPLVRTTLLFEHRLDEMEQQAQGTPRLAIPPDLRVRAARMAQRTFYEYGAVRALTGLPLDGLLAALGVVIAGTGSWRAARKKAAPGPEAMLLCWAAVTFVVSTAALGFDSSHYVMLPETVAILLEAVAVSWLAGSGWRAVLRTGALSRGRRSGTAA